MPGLAEMIYGTAQNAAQEQGQGLSQSLQAGAGLALKKEELDIQTGQLQAKMAELHQQKLKNGYEFLGNAHKYTNAADIANYYKSAGGYFSAMGIPELLPESAVRGMSSDDNMGRDVTARQYVDAGVWTPAQYLQAKADPAVWSKLPVATPESYTHADASVTTAMEKASQRKTTLEAAAIKAGASSHDFDKVTTELQKTASTQLAPVIKEQAAMQGAQDARDRVLKAIAEDPSGKTASPQDLGAMVFAMLHSDLGRVTEAEIEAQTHIKGAAALTQQQITDKFIGGVNPLVIQAVVNRLDSAVAAVDARGAKEFASLKQSIDVKKGFKPEEKSAMHSIITPLFQQAAREHPTVNISGVEMLPEQARQFYQSHPQFTPSPDTKRRLGL